MKQKLFTLLFFIIFIFVFSLFYGGEYKKFYQDYTDFHIQLDTTNKKLEHFSIENISTVQSVELYSTPSLELLDTIVEKINTAENRVYLEVYIFTEKRMLEALKNAQRRGVDVKVVLENNPYMAPSLNDTRYKDLQSAGIDVMWSNSDLYSLNHAKFLLIDNQAIISTGNMSYSTFSKNRDFLVFINDSLIEQALEELFFSDYQGKESAIYHDTLVLSPLYSRKKISDLFYSAEESIDMYFQYIKDDTMQSVIVNKAREGVRVRLIVDDNFYNDSIEQIHFLESEGIEVVEFDGSVMHSKAILVDDKKLFIGSVNFSSYSFDKNREVGIIISNKNIIDIFSQIFDSDFGPIGKRK